MRSRAPRAPSYPLPIRVSAPGGYGGSYGIHPLWTKAAARGLPTRFAEGGTPMKHVMRLRRMSWWLGTVCIAMGPAVGLGQGNSTPPPAAFTGCATLGDAP